MRFHFSLQTKRKFSVFYFPKLLLVGLFWVSVVTVLSWESYQQVNDPTYNYTLDSSNYLVWTTSLCVVEWSLSFRRFWIDLGIDQISF